MAATRSAIDSRVEERLADHEARFIAREKTRSTSRRVKSLTLTLGMVRTHQAHLPVLARVAHRLSDGNLDVEVVFGKIKIRSEKLYGPALIVPDDGEASWFVLPADSIEVEEARELGFTRMCERHPGHSHGLLSTTSVGVIPLTLPLGGGFKIWVCRPNCPSATFPG